MKAAALPPNPGILTRLRTRLLGVPDVVEDQLRDISKQGSGMARVAHLCALLLVILFSLGSLVALSGDALNTIIQQWQSGSGVNVAAAISVLVSTLLVLAMDVGMVYAASSIRLLNTRRAEAKEARLHYAVMVGVATLEALTYGYMSAVYEHPHSLVAWLLILARAGAAPFLATYLSLARPLPVTSRDILAQVELASGKAVIRDVLEVASDPDASLSQKVRMYGASAVMAPADRDRLDALIEVVQTQREPVRVVEAEPVNLHKPDHPPTGPGSPLAAPRVTRQKAASQKVQVLRLADPGATPRRHAARAKLTPVEKVRRALARHPEVSNTELAKLASVSRATVKRYREMLEAEMRQAGETGQVAL